MPKSSKKVSKKDDNNNNEDLNSILNKLPIAKAVLNNDLESLKTIIGSSLPKKNLKVQNLTMEQSVGEAFTGGRSTPCYYVHTQLVFVAHEDDNADQFSSLSSLKDRHFVIKLVKIQGDSNKDKVRRESYEVERRFYDHIAPHLKQHSIAVPKLLVSDDGKKDNTSDDLSIHCWIMSDLRVQYPLHPTSLQTDGPMIWAALDWLAKCHACFWKQSVGAAEWRRIVWERGGFWTSTTPTESIKNLSSTWLQTCQWITTRHPDLDASASSSVKTYGTRIAALHEPLAKFMTKQSTSTCSTLIHGDYKAANLFFSLSSEQARDSNNEDDVDCVAAAVDFQYSGAGVPAEDVAYLLFPDAFINYWDEESRLLEYYHEKLMKYLILTIKGGPSSFRFHCFKALYELSRIELLIYWISKGWVGSTVGDAKLVLAIGKTLDQIDGGKVLCGGTNQYQDALDSLVSNLPQ